MSGQPNMAARIAFWIVGSAFFSTIALLPNVLMGWWYYTGGQTHRVSVPAVLVCLGLLWATWRLGGKR